MPQALEKISTDALHKQQILILDFGSQYTQNIARRVREAQVFCEIHPCTKSLSEITVSLEIFGACSGRSSNSDNIVLTIILTLFGLLLEDGIISFPRSDSTLDLYSSDVIAGL